MRYASALGGNALTTPVGGLPEMRAVTWPSWSPAPVYVDELPATAPPQAPGLRVIATAEPVPVVVPQVPVVEPRRRRRAPAAIVASDEPVVL